MADSFALYLGEDKTLDVSVLTSSGAAQDITGWSLSWMLKRRVADTDDAAVLVKTTDAGIAITSAVDGTCAVSIADTDTDALKPGSYRHELKRMDAGAETVLLSGVATLKRGVHRS